MLLFIPGCIIISEDFQYSRYERLRFRNPVRTVYYSYCDYSIWNPYWYTNWYYANWYNWRYNRYWRSYRNNYYWSGTTRSSSSDVISKSSLRDRSKNKRVSGVVSKSKIKQKTSNSGSKKTVNKSKGKVKKKK